MAYKIAIDSGINSLTEDYPYLISNYISNRLNSFNVDNFLVRQNSNFQSDNDKANIIKNRYGTGNNIIVISNRLLDGNSNGAEIMYALRNNDNLAKKIADELEKNGQIVNKYYQLRDETDTINDADYLINNTKMNQTLAIYYGNINSDIDINLLKNNYENLAEGVVKAILDYINVQYIPNTDNYYVVKSGDSLWKIALNFNTTVDKIKKDNNLKSNNLSIGQILIINTNNDEINIDTNTYYTVQKGDSLYSISKKYNTTVDKLKEINNLTSNNLSIGQKLILPDIEINNNELLYTVVKGDSLWLIANKYDTTVDEIKRKNNLSSNNLYIGQKLIIPSSSNYTNYTVEKGDNLYSISKKYNTTVDKIKRINNLTSNNLSIGQKLLIES